uniref:Ig-like domain-containing protein n=1 Tax=Sus scrofa TaxID=9823 RepID=A0A8D1TKS4_PIG
PLFSPKHKYTHTLLFPSVPVTFLKGGLLPPPGPGAPLLGGGAFSLFRSPPGEWIIAVHAAHFLFLGKLEFFYNREEFVRFDSDLGEYRAVTESQKRVEVDRVCRLNYGVLDTFLVPRQTEPRVTVYPAKTQPLQHHNLLVCSVTGFYPGHVEVRWFRNGQEEAAGVVSTGLIPNGDWTFQTMVMLETVPQSGEVYSCRVEHPSLTSPVTVEWRVWSENAQNKKLSGLGGFVLGILFLAVGLFFCFRSQKGEGPVGGGLGIYLHIF